MPTMNPKRRPFSVRLGRSMLLAVIAFLPTPRLCQAAADAPLPTDVPESPYHLQLDFRYMYGNADGSLQTPSGGEPGTTSANRPNLGEIGIDHANIFDGSLTLQLEPHIFTFGAQIIHMDGSATLDRDLLSQSAFFPAGTSVNSKVHLDWYRVGYQYEFWFNEFRIAPGIEGVLLDFHYQLDGTSGGAPGMSADRSYIKGGMRIGGSAEWVVSEGGRLSIEGSAWWGVPIDNTAQISSYDIVAKWQLWGYRHASGGAAYAGVAFETIEYEDNQTVPNHINIDFGPMVIAGLQVRF